MARKNKHSVDGVLRSLSKKHDVKIDGNHVLILNGKDKKHPKKDDLGNGSWGKIDFLTNHCRFTKHFVSKF